MALSDYMPYDPADPYGLYKRPSVGADLQPLPQLSPPEEESLLSRMGGKVLGGLGYVGGLIDKYTGGRAVRGVLGGHPQELLSLLPGSDALGITNEKDIVSGRDLLDKAGLVNRDESGILPTVAGIATELALSPASYLTFGGGALTEAGQVAKKIGVLPSNLAGRATQTLGDVLKTSPQLQAAAETAAGGAQQLTPLLGDTLGGVVGIGLPFQKPSVVLGASQAGVDAVNAAKSGLNWVGHTSPLRYAYEPVANAVSKVAEPVGRHLNALFNHDVQGATTAIGQTAGRTYTQGVNQGMDALRATEVNLINQAKNAGILDQPGLIRQIGELPELPGPLPLQEGQAHNLAENMRAYLDKLDQEGLEYGFFPKKLADAEANYLPRHESILNEPTPGYEIGRGLADPLADSRLAGREEFLKNIPGGTTTIEQMVADPLLSGVQGRLPPGQIPAGINGMSRAGYIRQKYLGHTPEIEQAMFDAIAKSKAGETLTPAEELLASRFGQSQQLEDWLARSVDPKRLTEGFFSNHPIEDFMQTAASKLRRNEAAKAITGMLSEHAVPQSAAGPGALNLRDVLTNHLGMDAADNVLTRIAKAKGFPDAAAMGQMYVDPQIVKDAARFVQGFQTPAALKPLLKAFDYVTNLTKGFQTALWPGFHARNFMSGQWQNWVMGAHDARFAASDPRAWITPIKDAFDLVRGKTIEGAADLPLFAGQGLNDAEATRKLAELAYIHRAVGSGAHQLQDFATTAGGQAERLAHKIPGTDPFQGFLPTLREAGSELVNHPAARNPLKVTGAGTTVEDVFAPMKAGRKIGNAVEDTNRLSAFIGQLRQGISPEVAAQRVRDFHVDYSKLSGFERNVMRRLVPFYTYTRGIVPSVIEQLAQSPGGVAASWAKATHSLRNDGDTFVPEYLGGGLAIPIGEEANGTQRFFTRMDTPPETAFENLRSNIPDTLMGLLGQTNPLIKAPLEFATGKQFFTGRDLAELYPISGNTLLDQVIMNSPISRLATTARTLADERKTIADKALNLGTGLKISDVDMQRARELAERELIAEKLAGQQGIGRLETFYARPDALGQLTPDEIALLRLGKTLDARAKARSKERKERIGVRR